MPCPLCEEVIASSISHTPYERIWSSLAREYGAVFDPEVVERHTPAADAILLECHHCGLHYFSPAVPGDADFYRQLTSSTSSYYSDEKWDFQAAIERVAPGDRVLDIACGEGAWLQRVRTRGAEVCGIDTNPASVATAQNAGLPVYCLSLDAFAHDHPGRYDIVTAFQVIEHIPAVPPFVRAAKACLKPGGTLILTVPNRLRRVRAPFEPLDHPPHHLSRWTAEQFSVLAQLTGLKLQTICYQPASMSECRALLRGWIAPVGRSEAWWARALGRIVFGPSLYKLYRHFGLLDRWRLWRMSVLAVFQK